VRVCIFVHQNHLTVNVWLKVSLPEILVTSVVIDCYNIYLRISEVSNIQHRNFALMFSDTVIDSENVDM
jgi:hypothetical protein